MQALLKEAAKHTSAYLFNAATEIGIAPKRQSVLSAQSPFYFIVDYTQYKYLHVDNELENLLGYTSGMIMQAGPSFYTSLMHPADYYIFSEKVIKNNIEFIVNINPVEVSNYFFTVNYRLKNDKGEYRKILQRACCVEVNSEGLPMVMVGFALDITHVKENMSMVYTIEKINPNNLNTSPDLIFKETYQPSNTPIKITKRELEILRLLSNGLRSNSIAAKLFISEYTVNNHRKNLLKKAGAKSTAELIRYASTEGWL
jgi:DNA-binding CsgD family transcriptional regulator